MNSDCAPQAESSPPADDSPLQPLTEFWSAMIQHADGATRKMLEEIGATAAPQVWRERWLSAISQGLDTYLRSPAFLQALDEINEKLTDKETMKTWHRFLKLPDIAQAAKATVATTPCRVVYEEGTLKLLLYANESGAAWKEPVVICFALVNRPYILDLQADRSVVRQLLRRGFDVYLIDWGVPTASDKNLRLHDYVCRFMKNVADFVRMHSAAPHVNLLGYCMGGTMSTMFTSLYPQLVRNLILLAAPIDFSGDESLLNVWANEKHFDVDALIDAHGNCPGPFLQAAFQMTKPVQSFHEKFLNLSEKLFDDGFLENFFAMEQWVNDNIPVAGETFREFVKMLYQRNQLVQGQFRLKGAPVELNNIACPLLMLTADLDHLVAPRSTLALEDHVNSRDIERMSIEAGHIGLAVSSKAHAQLWPRAADWIAERSTSRSK